MKETPAAQEAFEDYYGMGPERSLPKLHEQYVERDQGGAELCPPTTRLNTLKEWSAKHSWQERVKERVRERAAGIRDKLEERAGQMRESVGGFLLVEISRLLETLKADETTVLVETVSDLEKEVKLFFQLAEQPLSDKIEHGGSVGIRIVPLPILSETDPLNDLPKEAGDDCPDKPADKPSA